MAAKTLRYGKTKIRAVELQDGIHLRLRDGRKIGRIAPSGEAIAHLVHSDGEASIGHFDDLGAAAVALITAKRDAQELVVGVSA